MTNDAHDSELLDEFRALERRLEGLRQRLAGELPGATGLAAASGLGEGERNILLCKAAGESVGLLLEHVDRVLPFAALAKLPEAPPWLLGMLNLHGESVPVLDVTARLSGEPREPQITDLVLVTTLAAGRVGLVVPEVHDIVPIEASAVTMGSRELPYARYLLGMLALDDRQLYLLDVSALAAMAAMAGVDEVHAQ
ncbi:MAG: chemotaxis protein CheW [Gammaproteobacteria bacterium]